MIRPNALRATLGLLLMPLTASACPHPWFSCIPRHHLALHQETGGAFAVTRGPASTTDVAFGLGADYFLLDDLSVGLRGAALAQHDEGTWVAAWSVGLRAGYNVPFSKRWSVWPRLGLGFDNHPRPYASANNFNQPIVLQRQYRTIEADAFAPIVVHPNRSFFVGLGPRLTVPLFVHAAGIVEPLRTVTFGLQLLVGGHF